MIEADVARFWTWFALAEERMAWAMRAVVDRGTKIDPALMGAHFTHAGERLGEFAPGLGLEFSRARDGACILTITAHGDASRFEDAFALVEAAPVGMTFQVEALRPRRRADAFAHAGVRVPACDLRFAYRLGAERIVFALLMDEAPPLDYRARRAFASAVAMEILGEEDFGRYVADVHLLEYEAWLAATPGGRSAPLGDMCAAFDRIFRRPLDRRRPPSPPPGLRLVG